MEKVASRTGVRARARDGVRVAWAWAWARMCTRIAYARAGACRYAKLEQSLEIVELF